MEGNAPKPNSLSCAFSGSDFKRVRVETSGIGHGTCSLTHPIQGASYVSMQRKNYMMPNEPGSDVFSVTLKEMKKEPMEIPSCGHSNSEMIFDFKDEGGGQIDPELQDLFDELTKTVPPLNDVEFEKILKQDDTFGLDLGRPSSAGAAANLCSTVEKLIKTENSQDFGQTHDGSPQLRPASAGPSFTMTSTSSTNTFQKSSALAGHSRGIPCWPEMSHAQQLKQMAANQQQPGSLLHHQPPQHVEMSSWASAMSSTTTTFAKAKGSSPAPLSQPRIGSHNKGISNCLFKSNGHNGSHHLDLKSLNSKPTLQFTPKAPHSTAAPMAIMTSPLNKTEPRQSSSPCQNQPQSTLHFQNQQMSTPGGLCLQPKPVSAALPFRLSQQQQGVSVGPRLPSLVQTQASAPTNQQKGPVKGQPMLRQGAQQTHSIGNTDKDITHDQFSRHLTRPPPDYKQSRNVVGIQQGNIFTGQNPSRSPNKDPENPHQSGSCQLSGGSKMSSLPSDRRFSTRADPSSCIGPFQQQNALTRFGLSQNKSRFLVPTSQGKSFGLNSVPSPGGPAPCLGNLGWASASKQAAAGLGGRRPPNPHLKDTPIHPYQQRHMAPLSQVAPDMGMLPLSGSIGDSGPRAGPGLMGCPSPLGGLSQPSPEQRVPAGSFPDSSPNSGIYHSRSNRVTFDFLPEGDNTVPGINADSDFIDSLLKSGSGNDDWMKDINLDEILGNHS